MLETTIAGSLPKPAWLAETNKLWPEWRQTGADLAAAKRDATLLAINVVNSVGQLSRNHGRTPTGEA